MICGTFDLRSLRIMMQAKAIVCLLDDFVFAHKVDSNYEDDASRSREHRGLGLRGDAVHFAWAMCLRLRCRIKWDGNCRDEPRGIAGCLLRSQ